MPASCVLYRRPPAAVPAAATQRPALLIARLVSRCAATHCPADRACAAARAVCPPLPPLRSSLKAALLLAHALVGEQRAALEELSAAVAMLLLPPAGTVSVDGGECWESETEAGWESSDSERDVTEEGWRKVQCRVQGASGSTGSAGATAASSGAVQPQCLRTRGSPCCAAAQPPPFSPGLLRFRSCPLESAFASFHARHMLWVDFCAYALCFALLW